jgi:hypothetical protein
MLEQFMQALSTQSKPDLPLEARLLSVSASERSMLMQLAKLVRISMRIHEATNDKSMTYLDLIIQLYGGFPLSKRTLVAEILDQTNPLSPRQAKPQQQSRQEMALSIYDRPEFNTSSEPKAAEDQTDDTLESVLADAFSYTADNTSFLQRLTQSESSGDTTAEITISDGRTFSGALQFGSARLADYKTATGSSFTQDEFKANTVLQDKVAAWHIADIDKAIDALGDKSSQYNRDGLRAVAHLGGKGGMKKYVQLKGSYNPADELGTSLQDYYDKFAVQS